VIGNDVIDLQAARKESNWKRKGFLEKIFTADERGFIASSADPELTVWILWSMKEAAYKIYNRDRGLRAYIPHLLVCEVNHFYDGTVTIEHYKYHTKTIVENDAIHTIAVYNVNDFIKVSEVPASEVLKDDNGLPYINSYELSLPISVSHHGRFQHIIGILQ